MDPKNFLHVISRISSFDNITLLKYKPLIICDIDNTILYHKKTNNEKDNDNNKYCFFTRFFDCFPSPIIREILPIDIKGFRRLEERVKKKHGKIIFLSARGEERKKTIESDFEKIGLDSKKYEIHYTTQKYSKGKYSFTYLRKFMHGELIFIDDSYENHLSMLDYFPTARYLLFCNNLDF